MSVESGKPSITRLEGLLTEAVGSAALHKVVGLSHPYRSLCQSADHVTINKKRSSTEIMGYVLDTRPFEGRRKYPPLEDPEKDQRYKDGRLVSQGIVYCSSQSTVSPHPYVGALPRVHNEG